MVYESLISIVEKNALKMAESWFVEVRNCDYMNSYNNLQEVQLLERGKVLFGNLQKWLEKGADDAEIKQYFEVIGENRLKEGFPLSEINYALFLEKKVLWSFIAFKDEVQGVLKPFEAVEFLAVLTNYFDLGEFYILKGYMNAMYAVLKSSGKFSDDELEKKIAGGALHKEFSLKSYDAMHRDPLDVRLIS